MLNRLLILIARQVMSTRDVELLQRFIRRDAMKQARIRADAKPWPGYTSEAQAYELSTRKAGS